MSTATVMIFYLLLFLVIATIPGNQGGCPYSMQRGLKSNSNTGDPSSREKRSDNQNGYNGDVFTLKYYKEKVSQAVCQTVTPTCTDSPYRSADGSCNNLNHPNWGKAYAPFKRWLPPAYDDGMKTPRLKGIRGDPLPSSRLVSTTIGPEVDRPSNKWSHLFMEFGQFLAHDLTLVPDFTGDPFDCCVPYEKNNKNCFNIDIPRDDYFYAQYNVTCQSFCRTIFSYSGCNEPERREQYNSHTSYIDASTVYGSTEEETRILRSFEGGKLKASPIGGPLVLPPQLNAMFCMEQKDEPPCLMASDFRVNQHPGITALHQLFFREHNRIAGTLARINPSWRDDDEKLFQESRKIVGAMMQHITFNEYLPIVLGERVMKEYNLNLLKNGFSNSYNKNIDATLSDGFATSGMRFGHTLAQGSFGLYDQIRRKQGSIALATHYFRPAPLYSSDVYDMFMRGLSVEPSQEFDSFFTHGMSNYFVKLPDLPYGLDLVAINIQRGRDVAIQSYTSWRKFCNLADLSDFSDLAKIMDSRYVDLYKSIYKNVEDIDIYMAQISEIPIKGETVGPILNCLLGRQFHDLKFGDRFWYENGGLDTSFTAAQLAEIRRASIARVLCDNTGITFVQRNALKLATSIGNEIIPCIGGLIPRINLEAWREPRITIF